MLSVTLLGVPLFSHAPPVEAATSVVAAYEMNEPVGATVMIDSGPYGLDGTIGSDVATGVFGLGAVGYRWPWASPTAPPAKPGRIVNVASNNHLNPGSSDYAVEFRYRTTQKFGNVVQKGQNATTGGYFKFEQPNGLMTCLFKGSKGEQRAVQSQTPTNDGAWHTIRCERSSWGVRLFIDGVQARALRGPTGEISNTKPLSIGGKTDCDQIKITCDYFTGDIDYVRIEKAGVAPPPNQPPTAVIAALCDGLTCQFDGAGSSDPDGVVAAYAWSFGDGGTANGSSVAHTFDQSGQYVVALSVVDDSGAVGTAEKTVTVGLAAQSVTYVGGTTASVSWGPPAVSLPNVEIGDTILLFVSTASAVAISEPTGISGWTALDSVDGPKGTTRVWWKTADAGDAGATTGVNLSANSKANIAAVAYRGTNTDDPILAHGLVIDSAYSSSRVTPQAWADDGSWAVSYWMHRDSTTTQLTTSADVVPRLQHSQSGGGHPTVLVADSNGPSTSPYGGLTATAAAPSSHGVTATLVLKPKAGVAPPPNQPPTAVIAALCDGLTCQFDGAGSSDPDGVVAAYAWSFGDGGTANGSSVAHTFDQSGQYVVALSVVDDSGAVGTAEKTVTVGLAAQSVTYVGGTTASVSWGPPAVSLPNVEIGDTILLFVSTASAVAISEPTGISGWTALDSVDGPKGTTRVWWKTADAGDAGATTGVNLSANSKANIAAVAYRGTNTDDPILAHGLVIDSAYSSSPSPRRHGQTTDHGPCPTGCTATRQQRN